MLFAGRLIPPSPGCLQQLELRASLLWYISSAIKTMKSASLNFISFRQLLKFSHFGQMTAALSMHAVFLTRTASVAETIFNNWFRRLIEQQDWMA